MALDRRRFVLSTLAIPGSYLLSTARARAVDLFVYDSSQLSLALASALPGDHIVLAGGTFGGDFVAARGGVEGSPVVIRAAEPLGAAITGRIRITGAHTWLSGLVLEDAQVELAADSTRMTRCRQLNTSGIALLVTRGHNVEIDHNEFAGMLERGISLKAIPNQPTVLQHTRIHHNHMRDFVGEAGDNVHEAIQLGQTKTHTDISLFSTVEHNLFERISVDTECVSIKSSDNVVRSNTLLDCRAHLTNRHGERNELSGNWLEGCMGIRLQDRGGRAIGNWLRDSRNGLQVMAGNVTAASWPGDGTHPAGEGWLLAGNNTDKCRIGYAFDGHTKHAVDTRVEGHTGQVALGHQKRTTQVPTTTVELPTLHRLSPVEVGPFAP